MNGGGGEMRAFLNNCALSCLGKVLMTTCKQYCCLCPVTWRRDSMGWGQSGAYWLRVLGLAVLFGDGRGQLLALGRPRGKSAGEYTCLHLSELTLKHWSHENQVSWRTGSWEKERL